MLHDRLMRAARSLALLCLALFAAAPAGADQITDSARTIWRDYTVDGVPTSGAWNPRKGDIRQFGALVGSSISALGAGNSGAALAFATKASLDASLAYAANTQAFVYADATSSNNGIYAKAGASGTGSWTKLSALVYGPTPTFGLGTVTITACNSLPAAAIGGTALAPLLNFSFPACNYDGAIPLPTPTTTVRGGVLATPPVPHEFVTGIDTATGDLLRARPVVDDLADSVPNAKLAQMGYNGFKCNNTGSASVPIDCTVSQATALLSTFTGDSGSGGVKGLVPAPAPGDAAAGKVLGASGGYVTPTAPGNWTACTAVTSAGPGVVACNVSTASADNTTDFNAAIAAVAAAGGGTIYLPCGTIYAQGVAMASKVAIVGCGRGVTIVKQKNSGNISTAVMLGPSNAYALFGAQTTDGIVDWVLRDLTIDGNMTNNTSGDCLGTYAFRFTITNVIIQNCYGLGWHSEGGSPVSQAMEAHVTNLLVDTTRMDGIYADGPHDSVFENVIVIDAGQAANNTYCGMTFLANMNARVHAFHGWHRSTAANRASSQYCGIGGGSDFSGSHFEGAWASNVFLNTTASANTFACDNKYYSAWNGLNILVRSPSNFICGSVLSPGAGRPNSVAIKLGDAAVGENASSNIIQLVVSGNNAGAVDFTESEGSNMIRINGYQSSGPKYYGTPPTSDDIDLVISGTTGTNLHQHP